MHRSAHAHNGFCCIQIPKNAPWIETSSKISRVISLGLFGRFSFFMFLLQWLFIFNLKILSWYGKGWREESGIKWRQPWPGDLNPFISFASWSWLGRCQNGNSSSFSIIGNNVYPGNRILDAGEQEWTGTVESVESQEIRQLKIFIQRLDGCSMTFQPSGWFWNKKGREKWMASFDSFEIAGSGRRISHLDMFPSFLVSTFSSFIISIETFWWHQWSGFVLLYIYFPGNQPSSSQKDLTRSGVRRINLTPLSPFNWHPSSWLLLNNHRTRKRETPSRWDSEWALHSQPPGPTMAGQVDDLSKSTATCHFLPARTFPAS